MKLTNAHQGRLAQIAGKAEPTTRPVNAFQARLGMIAGDESVTAVECGSITVNFGDGSSDPETGFRIVPRIATRYA